MSLKSELNRIIKEKSYISIDELEKICKDYRVKISSAERRLRESPNIFPVMKRGGKGQNYISGYGYVIDSKEYSDQSKNYKPEFILEKKLDGQKLL